MKENSEKEKRYKKLRQIIKILGSILCVCFYVSIFYIIIAINVFSVSYLYFAIGVPILLCVDITLILIILFLTKKNRIIKSEIYNIEKLTTTNPLFEQIIEEYNDNQFESLDQMLGKKWKVVDIDDYNNSIVICIKRRHGMSIEIRVSKTAINIYGKSEVSEENISICKNLTSENFTDISSVLVYIVETCERIVVK